MLKLIEHYLSLQGEGLRSGKLAYFVRFAGCNLRCQWCDSKFSFGKGKQIPFQKIVKEIKDSKAQFVCLTGGEPLLHEADCIRLIRQFPKVHFDIETGGALDISKPQLRNSSIIMDWKLRHSGMNDQMKKENLALLRRTNDLLKFVTDMSVPDQKEILKIVKITEKERFPISLQPLHGTNIKKCADWIIKQKNPRLQINLQIHKYIWPLNTRKV